MTPEKIELRVLGKKRQAKDAVSFTLEEINGKTIGFKPGQYLTFLFDDGGKEIRRCYSICASPLDAPTLEIGLKRVVGGAVSGRMVDDVKEGDELTALTPLGNFVAEIDPDTKRKLVLVGAGSGVTPLLSILRAALALEPETDIAFIYGNHDEESIMFREEIESLAEEYGDRFRLLRRLTAPSATWDGARGRYDRQLFVEDVKGFGEEFVREGEFYLCGPRGFMRAAERALEELGVEKQRVNKEDFEAPAATEEPPEEAGDEARTVTIILGGEKHSVEVKASQSVLEAALAQGLDIPYGCTFGSCAACKARLAQGEYRLDDQTAISEEDVDEGFRLTCVGYPLSDDVVIDYDDPDI
ncbi:MAG: 2Fe-2S iron-sulfur cluster binding domain-containing protein [Ignavibacteriales bacterium]|nr:2Fe-2S iron-sulfur cluster binding domain-containing protein [Ignavibacteriales bacterium]